MGKEQKRKSISFDPLTYQRVRSYCEHNDISMASFITKLIHARLDEEKWPKETVIRSQTAPKLPTFMGKDGEFTF